MNPHKLLIAPALLFASALLCRAEIKTTINYNPNESATSAFKFKEVPSPSKNDAAKAKFSIVDGERDENGGDMEKLNDGKTPTEEDQPEENFFFNAGTPGGRLLLDLGKVIEVRQVNTYSWHPSTRAPQVYKLYASDGSATDFNSKPKGTEPEKSGWKMLANVDTRPKGGGGQYAVSISNSDGPIGKFRYLLFDISKTESDDDFGNTFYSEIDVISGGDGTSTASDATNADVVQTTDGRCTITIDTSASPELKDWAEHKLAPLLAEWYPKIAAMLPSDGYEPPKAFSVTLRPGDGVAATGGTRITANSRWLKNELNREALGALLHEEVHVLQQYRRIRRDNPDAARARPPGWLVEGIPDYIRWFLYEPQSHGADVTWMQGRRNLSLNYDARYRVTANFLDYVINHYDKDKTLLTKVNAACRDGKYNDDLWKDCTGKTLTDLNDEWKGAVQKQLAQASGSETTSPGATTSAATQDQAAAESIVNALTASEKAAGWKLLFNGKDFTGWHNFKREDVRPGWQVKDGALVCADPHNAGDIVTADSFGWFELQLDYNISEGGNSGIMFHVTDEGNAAWATGPEFQLEDNAKAADPQRCGWLYALYQPPTDPNTSKPLDATKPAGEWNHIRLLISPDKCIHEINGVKYFEYVLGSDDFKERVAKSKFGRMPHFAKSDTGFIALQGDHGQVSFRNIKVRTISAPRKNS